jgi:hypothetical protein
MCNSRVLLLALLVAVALYYVEAMVPLPQHFTYGSEVVHLSSATPFRSSSQSSILQTALSRMHGQIFMFNSIPYPTSYQLDVSVKSDDENLQFGVGMQHESSFPFFFPFIIISTCPNSYSHPLSYISSFIFLKIIHHGH